MPTQLLFTRLLNHSFAGAGELAAAPGACDAGVCAGPDYEHGRHGAAGVRRAAGLLRHRAADADVEKPNGVQHLAEMINEFVVGPERADHRRRIRAVYELPDGAGAVHPGVQPDGVDSRAGVADGECRRAAGLRDRDLYLLPLPRSSGESGELHQAVPGTGVVDLLAAVSDRDHLASGARAVADGSTLCEHVRGRSADSGVLLDDSDWNSAGLHRACTSVWLSFRRMCSFCWHRSICRWRWRTNTSTSYSRAEARNSQVCRSRGAPSCRSL